MPSQSAQSVLLLDDDRFLLDMYSTKFIQKGFTAHACQSVSEALSLLRGGLRPEALLFDIVMPGQDGLAFLHTVTSEKLGGDAVRIALTNQSNDNDQKDAEKFGADRFVIKASMIPSEVVSMVIEEIEKKRKSGPKNTV